MYHRFGLFTAGNWQPAQSGAIEPVLSTISGPSCANASDRRLSANIFTQNPKRARRSGTEAKTVNQSIELAQMVWA
ncbi:MAG: hypothetical protein JWS11_1608 [Cypionkella sp.]|nr:hypothetical protein [Cypionkella sp.]